MRIDKRNFHLLRQAIQRAADAQAKKLKQEIDLIMVQAELRLICTKIPDLKAQFKEHKILKM